MTLNPQPSYPSTRSYVLKLHRDARPARDEIAGRLENMATGDCFEFRGAEELLERLAAELASAQPIA
jgi:hypothetical protein